MSFSLSAFVDTAIVIANRKASFSESDAEPSARPLDCDAIQLCAFYDKLSLLVAAVFFFLSWLR